MSFFRLRASLEQRYREQAHRELAALPMVDGDPDRVAIPMKSVEHDGYVHSIPSDVNARIDKARIHPVPLSQILGIQRTVSRDRVRQYIDNPDLQPPGALHPEHGGPVDHPIVIQRGHQLLLHDGHHRCVAAKLMKHQSIDARLVLIPE